MRIIISRKRNTFISSFITAKGANRISVIAVLMTALLLSMFTGGIYTPAKAASDEYRTEVTYDPISVPAILIKTSYIYQSDYATVVTKDGVRSKLKKGTSVTVIGDKQAAGRKWFYVEYGAVSGSTEKGYIKASNISLKNEDPLSAKTVNIKSTKALRAKADVKKALKVGGKVVRVPDSASVKFISEKYVGSAKWYYISYQFDATAVNGYIKPKFVQLEKRKRTVKIYALSEAEFEEEMNKQGIPDIYKQYLRALHEAYPFWEFRLYDTGLDWATALAAESKVGRNLISNAKSRAWKSTDPAAYDAATDTWKVFDGSTWVAASKEAVAYYMDPRNFLNERTIYQFELQAYEPEYQTRDAVNKILNNTPFYGADFTYTDPVTGLEAKMSYVDAFIAAAENSSVSPLHLASRAKQEVVTSATTVSGAISGNDSTYPGIYNFYNIGSTSGKNAVVNGLKWASDGDTYMRPWTDPYLSIVGGALYIGSKYISRGQDTVYLEKFNVTETDRYNHQYMTNVEAAYAESIKIQKAYSESGLLQKTPIVFKIPYYSGMPAEVCAAPQ